MQLDNEKKLRVLKELQDLKNYDITSRPNMTKENLEDLKKELQCIHGAQKNEKKMTKNKKI